MRHYVLALALSVACSVGAEAATIVNGGFESPENGSLTYQTIYAGEPKIPGWQVGGAGVDVVSEYWYLPASGEQSLDLNSIDAGTIRQEITDLTAGTYYEVSFDASINPVGASNLAKASVSVGDAYLDLAISKAGITPTNMNWTRYSLSFFASGTSETLLFASRSPYTNGVVLDNVTIANVPLPGTLLFLIAGLGGLAALRRCKA